MPDYNCTHFLLVTIADDLSQDGTGLPLDQHPLDPPLRSLPVVPLLDPVDLSLSATLSTECPVIYHPTFSIRIRDPIARTIAASIEMASAARDLRDFFEHNPHWQCFQDASVLELVEEDGNEIPSWRLRIRVKVTSWFQFWYSQERETSLENAQRYLRQLENLSAQENSYILRRPERQPTIIEQCRTCSQPIIPRLRLADLESSVDPNFAIQARNELLRELNVMPYPGKVEHFNNRQIIKYACVYQEIFRIINVLEIRCRQSPLGRYISFNYGHYESGTSQTESHSGPQDPNCHAHFHISLSINALTALVYSADDPNTYPLFAAYNNAQRIYWEKDIQDLKDKIAENIPSSNETTGGKKEL